MKALYKWILQARENTHMNHIKEPKLPFYLLFAVIQDMS